VPCFACRRSLGEMSTDRMGRMPRFRGPRLPLLLFLLGLAACRGSPPYPVIPEGENPARWAQAVARFEERDREAPPPPGGVVFVGSSSIVLWRSLTQDMAPLPVIQRGFGGSRLFDAIYYADRLVSVHDPSVVVVFSGTNDIRRTSAKTAVEVRDLFRRLTRRMRRDDPKLTICYISITPTQARANRIPVVRQANRLIRADCQRDDRMEFIDAASPLMDSKGEPDPRWFMKDGLHLNADGYAVWTRCIRPVVLRCYREATGVDLGPVGCPGPVPPLAVTEG